MKSTQRKAGLRGREEEKNEGEEKSRELSDDITFKHLIIAWLEATHPCIFQLQVSINPSGAIANLS